jgi:uncharacterized protein YecE (DUF72 family)
LLADNLGPILFQLPPGWTANLDRLAEFLPLLPRTHRYALEFRDQSWSTPATRKLVRSHNIALCIHDWRGLAWPVEITADFIYIRLHRPGGRYQGNHDKRKLRQWASRIQQWRCTLSRSFVYFNNDQGGDALADSQTLRAMVAPGFAAPPKAA